MAAEPDKPAYDRAATLGDLAGARRALAAWRRRIGDDLPIAPLPRGLVNATFAIGRPPRFALQLMHPQFGAETLARLAAMAPVLAGAGVAVPTLLPADDGRVRIRGPGGGHWRLTAWLDGTSRDTVASPAHARSASAYLAMFHDALAMPDFADWPASTFHDTDARLAALAAALGEDGDGEARRLAEAILANWTAWRDAAEVGPTPPRPGHGDPKISNFQFRGADACGLLDLDLAARFPLDDDLGDALRSWCNPAGEDDPDGPFDEAIFAAAVAGYLGRARSISADERRRIVHGTVRIALELASRFCLDAIRQDYFAWDPAVAPSRRAHNLLRATGQLAFARRLIDRRAALERQVAGLG
jgi:Ser/Thr protein kinase RdoA (MazF antagonist)